MRIVFVFVVLLALVGSAHADSLVAASVSATEFVLNQTGGTTKTYAFSMTNDGNETLHNISFEPLPGFVFPSHDSLPPNETIELQFSYESALNRTGTVNSRLFFFFSKELNEPAGDFDVSLTSASFEPQSITMPLGSVLHVRNDDTATMILRSVNGTLDVDIGPGVVANFTMGELGSFLWYEQTFGATLSLEVVDNVRDTLVHNSDLDISFSFEQLPTSAVTVLEAEVLTEEFNLKYDKEGQGAVRVSNNGVEVAEGVFLSGEWVRYDDDPVDIPGGESRVLVFTTKPEGIKEKSDTNKTYAKALVVESSNAGSITTGYRVFIEFNDFSTTEVNGTIIKITRLSVKETIAFCEARPGDSECEKLVQVRNRTVIKEVYRNTSVTEEDVEKSKTATQDLLGRFERTENTNRELTEKLTAALDKISTLEAQANELSSDQAALEQEQDDEERRSNAWGIFWWVFISLVVGVLASMWLVRAYNTRKQLG